MLRQAHILTLILKNDKDPKFYVRISENIENIRTSLHKVTFQTGQKKFFY